MKKICIISPCYNEEANIQLCYEAVREVFQKQLPNYEYEQVFVDNASIDKTVSVLRKIAVQDKRVKVIINSRNYGPFRSTFNALKSVEGDAVLVMLPVDLQDPPELIPQFIQHWEKGAKIVYGQRTNREESFFVRKLRGWYYRTVRAFADISIPVDTAEFQLIDKQVHQALIRSNDAYPYIRGMIANCGFSDASIMIPYTWQARKRGISKNRFYNLIDQGLNGIISFTNVPLRMVTFVGFTIASLSLLYAIIQLLLNLLAPGPLAGPGIPTLIVAIFFFSGIQMFIIGLLGEYIGAIHNQVRRGPDVIEKERINF